MGQLWCTQVHLRCGLSSVGSLHPGSNMLGFRASAGVFNHLCLFFSIMVNYVSACCTNSIMEVSEQKGSTVFFQKSTRV